MYKVKVISIDRGRIISEEKDFLEVSAEIFTEDENGVATIHATLKRAYPLEFNRKEIQKALKQELDGWVRDKERAVTEIEKAKLDKKVEKTIAMVQDLVIE